MRIAFLNRGRETHPGGDVIALDATMEAVRRRGHVAEEIGWHADKLADFDICHLMHCNFDWAYGGYRAIQVAKKPYVLTPIYYPGPQGPLLSGLTRDQLREIIDGAARILPFSKREISYAFNFNEHLDKWRPIPNGTDEMFHHRDEGKDVGIVCCVSARGDSDKGIPMLRRVCKRISVKLDVLTGMPRKELADALKRCFVFVNASPSERMSLTIGEALCSQCRVIATDQNWGNEHYPGIITFDPNDETKLEQLLMWALDSVQWDYRPNSAARCLTWDWVAGKLEEVYREVLSV